MPIAHYTCTHRLQHTKLMVTQGELLVQAQLHKLPCDYINTGLLLA